MKWFFGLLIGAAVLAFGVWFAEWYHQRKIMKKSGFSAATTVAALFFLLISCNTQPEPFQVGKDVCYFCKMGITDTRFGGEVITKKGIIRKFDDLHCMISFLKGGGEDEKNISQKVTVNFEKPTGFTDVASAIFVISPDLKSPMGSNAAGFANKEAADSYVKDKQAELVNWQQLYNKVQ